MAQIVITGANRGIGLALTRLYRQQGDDVIALCRSGNEELEQMGCKTVEDVDVGSDASIERLANRLDALLEGGKIDVLINNAGILISDQLDSLEMPDLRRQFEVNTLGPLRVTKALLPLMGEGAKVAIISSRVGSITDNGSGNNYGYRVSKTAVNMVGTNLAHDLKPLGITVLLLHPGYVSTDMVNFRGPTEPEDSAKGLMACIKNAKLENSGQFLHAEGYELPW